MSLQSDELEDRNIVGTRKSLAMLLQQNWINVSIVVLIITYALLTFIFMSVDKDLDNDIIKIIYHTIESVIIFMFICEVIVYKYAFKELYLTNKFNIINLILTGIILCFWIFDIFIENYHVSVLLRIRGVVRLCHVPVILESMKSYHRLQKSLSVMETMQVDNKDKPNAERVVETLLQISDIIEEPKIYSDLHFCIKQIASGKLYEAEQVDLETEEVKSLRRRRGAILQMEETAWIRSATRILNLKRDSNDSGTIIMAAGENRSLESLLNFDYNLTETMESLDTMEFNIFDFRTKTKNRELTSLTSLLLHKHSLYSGLHIPINKFLVFMDKITSGYNRNAAKYHHDTHAADVCQTLYYFIINGNWITLAKMDNIDICSMILAAAVHDYEHPGFNNVFLINTKDTLALRYNDISVLESHHIASSSALMKLEKYNIFSKLAPDDASGIRQRMVHMVLSTDMSKHFADIGTFKQR